MERCNMERRTRLRKYKLAKKQALLRKKMIKSKTLRKGVNVIVISGNYRGQTGTVLSINDDKAIVQGLNIGKKHVKKSQNAPQGSILSFERPIHVSNLKVCDENNNPLKLRVKFNDDGEKFFVYGDKDNEVVYRSIKNFNPKRA